MKKTFIYLVILFGTYVFSFSQETDSVWTKNIWPENVSGVLFSPDGSNVYVSTNKRVWVINTLTGDSIRTVFGIGGFRNFSNDGKFIYTSSLRKLDTQTFNVVNKYDTIPTNIFYISDIAFNRIGNKLYVVSSYDHYDTIPPFAHFYDNLAIFDADNMKFLRLISFPEKLSNIIASDDGKFLITLSGTCDSWWPKGQEKGCKAKLTLWDAQTVQPIKTIYEDTTSPGVFKFTPDSKNLAAAIGGKLYLYETTNFSIKNKIDILTTNFNFTNDNKFVIIGGGKIGRPETVIWNIENNNIQYEYFLYDSINNLYYTGGVNGIDVNSNNSYIISASAFLLCLLNGRFDGTLVNDTKHITNLITIVPNPINGNALITFNLSSSDNINVAIFSESGIKLKNLFEGYMSDGKHDIIWDTSTFPSGMYYCRIIGNGLNLNYKIIITK